MTFKPCSNTGALHRLFTKDEKNAPRHSIGTVCPRCGIDLWTHSEAGNIDGFRLAAPKPTVAVAALVAALVALAGGPSVLKNILPPREVQPNS